ncbi:alkaline shock response membrane anchor protein AmaP [Wenjunlia tyrosinilytica]|uniref:Alkaline shock response membrane anchor protein AmaP n=1 Tax=Wenjunlia tyrosinilytica TaxID=1544741 RepID=A0A918DTC1_9ACTN|nr:alkaline shock response membrane anchor protein AmaP [Wenjunlia tyrosinilytica]GGO81224.1 hypothetical protein GCM10012280_04920 [Wenjunlia tyrosinilytica]
MRKIVNRVLLGLIGLALFAVGALVLIGGLDLPRHWGFTLPSWWPLDDPDQSVLSRASRTRWRDEGWWWPTVFAVLGALVVLTLWWLLAQVRHRRLAQLRIDVGEGGNALLRGPALEHAIEMEARRMEGVDGAKVTLHRRRGVPGVKVALTLAAHAEPGRVLETLETEQLGNARASVALDVLPSEVRLRSDRHPATRVE